MSQEALSAAASCRWKAGELEARAIKLRSGFTTLDVSPFEMIEAICELLDVTAELLKVEAARTEQQAGIG